MDDLNCVLEVLAFERRLAWMRWLTDEEIGLTPPAATKPSGEADARRNWKVVFSPSNLTTINRARCSSAANAACGLFDDLIRRRQG